MTPPAARPLGTLLEGVHPRDVRDAGGSALDTPVSAVEHDNRRVGPGALFCCLKGATADGHDLAGDAVAAGAVALLVERPTAAGVPEVEVDDVRAAMAHAAAALHDHPSRVLQVVGVTGTNGKTTVADLLASILEAAGRPTEVIGTLTRGSEAGAPPTTPEAPALQARLAAARDAGRAAVVMEVTSIGLARRRVDAVDFAAAVFTNLTQDHLEFHHTMDAYFEAKALLFDGRSRVAVVNRDDEWGRRLLGRLGSDAVAYSLEDATDVTTFTGGTSFTWRGTELTIALEGEHNVSNAIAAATVAEALAVPVDAIVAGLGAVTSVPGRFEPVGAGQPFAVRVDYAHTPDALEHALHAARALAAASTPVGRVFAVFGCGGDRDRAKRPLMGRLAADLADVAILTSDNPRSEDPAAILAEVEAGAPGALRVEGDRAKAIREAVSEAGPGDVVLIAGKGHEQGQEVAGRMLPFDDRDEARAALREAGWDGSAPTGEGEGQ